MNTLDMYTREKVNKIHLDEIHQDAKNRHNLRDLEQEWNSNDSVVNRRRTIAVAVMALIAATVSFIRRI
jgi:hypothetical protein